MYDNIERGSDRTFLKGDFFLVVLAALIAADIIITLSIGTELNLLLKPLVEKHGLETVMKIKAISVIGFITAIAILGRYLRKEENRRFNYEHYTAFVVVAYVITYSLFATGQLIVEVIRWTPCISG